VVPQATPVRDTLKFIYDLEQIARQAEGLMYLLKERPGIFVL
jgi:hypothetical protein